MIPYDDLVASLASWRARQGLPVAAVPGGAPARQATPAARPAAADAPAYAAAAPRPGSSGLHDFDESSLIEESAYDADDGAHGGESTMIGSAEPRRGQRPDGW